MKRLLLVALLVGVIALPVVLYVRVRIAEAAWARSFGPIDALPSRFHGEANETTGAIPKWIARLGTGDERHAVGDFILQQSTSDMPVPTSPSNAVDHYVASRAALFDEIASWMGQHPPPSWPVHLSVKATVPNFIELMQLQKMVIAVALVREQRGDHRGAERLLAASWKLTQGLRDRPEVISQIVAMPIFRWQCMAIRKMRIDPIEWLPRIREHDYRASLRSAYQARTYVIATAVKSNAFADSDYLSQVRAFNARLDGQMIGYVDRPRWIVQAMTPIRWFDLPALLEGMHEVLLESEHAPIRESEVNELTTYKHGFGKWFYIPDPDLQPEYLGPFTRANRVMAEAELTEKVLIARAARATNNGQWPKSIEGFAASRIADGSWIYEPSRDGVTIHFSRELTWPHTGVGYDVPMRCTLTSGS